MKPIGFFALIAGLFLLIAACGGGGGERRAYTQPAIIGCGIGRAAALHRQCL